MYEAHLTQDDLGSTNLYPSLLKHNKNGQLIAVCDDGDCFGEAPDFAWTTFQDGSSCYAAKTAASNLKSCA